MGKLSLVLADSDEEYIGKLYDYIIRNYSVRFHVSLYTEEACLMDYLLKADKKIDILLISADLYSHSITKVNVSTLILLSCAINGNISNNYESINKYQPADKLINSLINIYSEKNDGDIVLNNGNKKTKVVGFFSPSGGVGKTTVSVAASIMSAEMDNMVFYLNLEDINSTTAFFKATSNQNMSSIFYFLKEKNKNLPLKIEGVRCIDDNTGVHFFSHQESCREIEDILPEEYTELIKSFVKMSQYDYLFIDMSNSLNDRNLTLLESCDSIIFVLSDDEICSIKATAFINELAIIESKNNISLTDKITLLINKNTNNPASPLKSIEINGESANINIPFIQGLTSRKLPSILKESGSSLSRGISELLNSI